MTFKEFVIKEAVFKKSKKITPISWGHLPMFTLYSDNELPDEIKEEIEFSEELMKDTFEEARNKIHQLGFPSMHAYVVFKDLQEEKNQNTGGGVGGEAFGSPNNEKYKKSLKYMTLDANSMLNSATDFPVRVIVHEWAHLWMFKHHKEFRNAIKEYYESELMGALDALDKPYEFEAPTRDEIFSRNYTYKGVWDFNTDDDITTYIVSQLFQLIYTVYHIKFVATNEELFKDDPFLGKTIQDSKNLSAVVRTNIKSIILGAIKLSNIYVKKKWEFDQELDPKIYKNPINQLAEYCSKLFLPRAEKYVDRLMKLEKEEAFYSNTIPNEPGMSNHTKHLLTRDYDEKFNTFLYIDDEMVIPETISWTLMDMIKHSEERVQIQLVKKRKKASGRVYNDIREKIASIVKWVSAYGMSDEDEMWATAMEKFLDLPREHRSKILKLMMS